MTECTGCGRNLAAQSINGDRQFRIRLDGQRPILDILVHLCPGCFLLVKSGADPRDWPKVAREEYMAQANKNPILELAIDAARAVGRERPAGQYIADEIARRIEDLTDHWPPNLATMKQRITQTIHQWLIAEAPLTQKLVDRLAEGIVSGELLPSRQEHFGRINRYWENFHDEMVANHGGFQHRNFPYHDRMP